ncbi:MULTISPECIES: hypothetical protein [Falsihalocynthiibacter]|uniref:hypothetical protein n=1 Tax=Falsihalocynthiibacter TaxID=2854182 RepID=UPI003001B9BC
MDFAHFGKILAHLSQEAWVLLPRNSIIETLNHALPRAKAIIGNTARKAFILERIMDFAEPGWREIGTGDACGFLKGELGGLLDMQRHTTQCGAVLAVGRKGVVALGPF